MKYPILICLLLLSLIASKLQAADPIDSAEQNLLIIYSNDVSGETEPCG